MSIWTDKVTMDAVNMTIYLQALYSDGRVIMTVNATPGFSWIGKILQLQPLISQVSS